MLIPGALAAQAGRGSVVLRARLGGDSAQATTVRLRRGATYRVAAVPASAELRIKTPSADSTPPRVLDRRPLEPGDSVAGGAGFLIVAGVSAEHLVELAGERHATAVEITLVSLAPGDHIQPTTGSQTLYTLLASPNTPNYVDLDSGVVYRVWSTEDVFIEPRNLSGAPVRLSPQVRANGVGVPFIPAWPGEYKVWASDEVAVRVLWNDFDQAQIQCIRHPQQRGCMGEGTSPRSGLHEDVLVTAFVAVGAVLWMLAGRH